MTKNHDPKKTGRNQDGTFKKGLSGNPAGKPKGVRSAQKKRFEEALNTLLEDASEDIRGWYKVAQDDPKGALDVLTKLAEYVHPKMQRVEHTGKNGDELKLSNILMR